MSEKDDDIVPPIMPQEKISTEDVKKGFFNKLFTKKQVEGTPEKEVEVPKPAPEEPPVPPKVEEKPATQTMPEPPPETLLDEAPAPKAEEREVEKKEREEVKVSAPIPSPEEEAKPDIDQLEDRLATLQKTTPKHHVAKFTVLGGKEAITLKDLQKVVKQQTPQQFKEHHAANDFAVWVKHHLFDDELALKLHGAKNKEALINIIDQELKPKIKIAQEKAKQVNTPHEAAEEHFEKLQQEHEQHLEELKAVVASDKPIKDKDYLKRLLIKKDDTLVQNITDLHEALTITEQKTYEDVITKNKEHFLKWLEEIIDTTGRISAINPQKVLLRLREEIDAYKLTINKQIENEENIVKEQGKQLLEREDALAQAQATLKAMGKELEEEEKNFDVQQEQWATTLQERLAEVEAQRKSQASFVEEQEQVLKSMKEEQAAEEEREKQAREELQELRSEVVRQQNELLLKQQESEKKIEERERDINDQLKAAEMGIAKLKSREAHLEKEKAAFEEEMQKREQLVQETVNRIISIDQDIHDQRTTIEEMKQELDTEGFKKYLKSALKELKTDHLNFAETKEEEQLKEEHTDLYTKIEECNRYIEVKKLDEAKRSYTELKRMFEEAKLNGEEKDILFDAIRELYTNLHLALLEK